MKTLCCILIAAMPCAVPAVAQAQSPKRPPAVAKVTVPGAVQDAAQTTIYKLVDDRGHVTYSNRPMKGAEVVDLEPITVIPGVPRPTGNFQQTSNFQIQPQAPATTPANASSPQNGGGASLAAALATPSGAANGTALPSATQLAMVQPITATVLPNVETGTQQKRDDSRRRILEEEMKAEQKALAESVLALSATESDRTVIEQMRLAAAKQTPSAYAEARRNYDLREEKLRTLQESVNTHEKNVVALKKELAALR